MSTETIQSEAVLVPEHAVPYLAEKIDSMSRRPTRIRLAAPKLVVHEVVERRELVGSNALGEDVYRTIREARVSVEGVRPKLDGWDIVANLVRVGDVNVVRAREGAGIHHEDWRQAVNRCDHCGTQRKRNETWLFRRAETGELRQVARNCCQDFVGVSAVDLAAMAGWSEIVGMLSDPDVTGAAASAKYRPITWHLAATAALVRVFGWVPQSRATKDKHATVAHVGPTLRAQECPNDRYDGVLPVGPWPEITPDDYQSALDALEWIRLKKHAKDPSEYIRNAHAACSVDYVVPKTGAIVASVIGAAYPNAQKRAQEERAKAQATKESAGYVGELKERIEISAEVRKVRHWEGGWGTTTFIELKDSDGHLFQWKASGYHEIEEGAHVAVRGTIKAHVVDRYTGEQVTALTRCRIDAEGAR